MVNNLIRGFFHLLAEGPRVLMLHQDLGLSSYQTYYARLVFGAYFLPAFFSKIPSIIISRFVWEIAFARIQPSRIRPGTASIW